VKRTRKIVIRNRVFSLEDLKRIAELFDKQAKLARKSDHHASSEYEISFSNNTSISGDSPEILDDKFLNAPGRPVVVRLAFRNFTLGRHLSFEANHGDSTYSNIASVSADEPDWVNDNFLSLEEAIQTVRPQTFWFRRHPTLLLNLIALGAGSLIQLAVQPLLQAFIKILPFWSAIQSVPADSPWRQPVILAVLYLFIWITRWFTGFCFAFEIRRWLLQLWPNVELNIGSEHLKTEIIQRRRLVAVIVLIVLPVITSAIYDIIK
jgi:hypothetical protein